MGYKGQNTVKTVLSVAHLKQKTHIKYNQSPSHKICLYNEPEQGHTSSYRLTHRCLLNTVVTAITISSV